MRLFRDWSAIAACELFAEGHGIADSEHWLAEVSRASKPGALSRNPPFGIRVLYSPDQEDSHLFRAIIRAILASPENRRSIELEGLLQSLRGGESLIESRCDQSELGDFSKIAGSAGMQ
jgi:hypothetical protein